MYPFALGPWVRNYGKRTLRPLTEWDLHAARLVLQRLESQLGADQRRMLAKQVLTLAVAGIVPLALALIYSWPLLPVLIVVVNADALAQIAVDYVRGKRAPSQMRNALDMAVQTEIAMDLAKAVQRRRVPGQIQSWRASPSLHLQYVGGIAAVPASLLFALGWQTIEQIGAAALIAGLVAPVLLRLRDASVLSVDSAFDGTADSDALPNAPQHLALATLGVPLAMAVHAAAQWMNLSLHAQNLAVAACWALCSIAFAALWWWRIESVRRQVESYALAPGNSSGQDASPDARNAFLHEVRADDALWPPRWMDQDISPLD